MIRSRFISAVVWLTVSSTLLAGTPHVACQCPDGTVRVFCSMPAPSVEDSGKQGEHSCCKKKTTLQSPVAPEDSGPSVRADTCQKHFVAAQSAVSLRDVVTLEGSPLLSVTPSTVVAPPVAAAIAHECANHDPPPRHLVVVLQHFLI